MSNTLVSVIIPAFNRAHFIGETLDSVIAQTYPNWECIVVDDGSIDYTEELMEFYCEGYPRIQFHHRPKDRPKGANACRNYGFELSKGEYIQWLDSDDLLGASKLELQLLALQIKSKAALAICPWIEFSVLGKCKKFKEQKVFRSFDVAEEFMDALAHSGGFLPPHTYLMSRGLVEKAGDWLEYLEVNQDGEFFSRVFIRMKEVVYIEGVKVLYRRNEEESLTSLNYISKAEHAILSWIIIENNFKIRFGKGGQLVNISKKYLYFRMMDQFPELIKKYKNFFQENIENNNGFVFKIPMLNWIRNKK